MVDKPQAAEIKPATEGGAPATPPPRRPPGHRSTDVRDTVAEMAARAQEISQEAGSKIALAMKEVISAAAGLTGFSIESARDVVQYMVRRGQMAPEEAERIIRDAEGAPGARKLTAPPKAAAPAPTAPAPAPAPPAPPVAAVPRPAAKPVVKPPAPRTAPAAAPKQARPPARPPVKSAAKKAPPPARARAKPAAKTAAARKKK